MAVTKKTSMFRKNYYSAGFSGAVLADGAQTTDVGQQYHHTITATKGTATSGTLAFTAKGLGGSGPTAITSGTIDLSTADLSIIVEGVFEQFICTPSTTNGTYSVEYTGRD